MKLVPTLKLISAAIFLPFLLAIGTILFINPVFAQNTIDLAAGEQDLTIFGGATRDALTRCPGGWRSAGGCSPIASGDFNGDGVKDILTTAVLDNLPKAGAVYVFFGSQTMSTTIDIALGEQNFTILPKDTGDVAAASLVAGDVNGDGIDDIIIGNQVGDGPGTNACVINNGVPIKVGNRCGGGEVYIIFGSPTLSGTIDLSITNPNVIIYGADRGDLLGASIAVADVNVDGLEDILVTAFDADGPGTGSCPFGEGTGDRCSAGEAYVIFGSTSLPGVIDLLTTTPNLIIYGDVNFGRLGIEIAAGDVNGDGVKDILVNNRNGGAFSSPNSLNLYAIFGSSTLSGIKDIALGQQNLTILAKDSEHRFTGDITSGDVNGDGIEDILLGASGNGPDGSRESAGEAYVIFGSATLSGVIDIGLGGQNFTIFGEEAFDFLERGGLAAGDVNGDGIEDIVTAAPFADGPGLGSCAVGETGDRCSAGEAYVIFGSSTLAGTLDLATTSPDLTIFGADLEDQIGSSNALATSDINGDGIEDILIGSSSADGPGTGTCENLGGMGNRCEAGELYVIFGSSADLDGDGVPDAQDSCPAEDATGFDANADGCVDTIQGLIQIIATLPDGTLSDQIETSLVSKVQNAQKSSDKTNICAAVNQLGAFINEVDGQRAKKVSDEAANDLIAYAQSVIAALNSQLPAGETCK